MSITYYAVVEGDPLDNGGNSRVLEGARHSTIDDPHGQTRGQTHLGHKAWCSVCQSIGVIVAAAGISNYLRAWDGRLNAAEAVGGDAVLCKCERLPKIVSRYARCVEYVDSGPAVRPNVHQPVFSPSASLHWISFLFREDTSYVGLSCVAHFADGSTERGAIDSDNRVRFTRSGNASCQRIELENGESATTGGSVCESLLASVLA